VQLDLVIRNGRVVDGSGFGAYRADVGIVGDRIAVVGRIRERGRVEIDADGHAVTPGFIDGHTHMDAQVFWDRLGVNSCWHGVTTVVMGNCGFTLAPVRADARALVVRNLERAEDIDPTALATGIEWSWETFAEYLDAVDGLPKGIHYAANIGHSALRTYVMGERAFTDPATEDDLVGMERELADALRAGAVGFTTSRSEHHETSDDRPVASRLATWEEVVRLVGVMGDLGVGMLEGGSEGVLAPDPDVRAQAVQRVRALAGARGVPMTSGILATDPGGREMLALIDDIAAAGGRMIGQSHCRGINVLLSFRTRLPFDLLPEWQPLRAQPLAEQRRMLADPALRSRLADAAMHGDYTRWRGIGAMPRRPDFDRIRVYEQGLPPNPTVADVAAARGVSPAAAMIDLALETDFEVLFIQPSLYPQDEDVLLEVMRHPRTVMTFSDSGAHLSQISDSSIHTHLLGYWVREREEFTLEEAVRMLTLAPAMAWGFSDRGLLREGMVADVNVFDPTSVGPAVPEVVADLPGGGNRLSQRAHGFRATVVAGEVTILDGAPTGATPGRLVRNRLAECA
jgi:N-acyl-D-aspartate/D-glutamate deacylase